jgi:hypothetical protein
MGGLDVRPDRGVPSRVPARVRIEEVDRIRFADLRTELGSTAQRVGLP